MTRSTLLGLTSILLWSSTVAFSRTLSEKLGPFTTGALIYILGGCLGLIALSRSQDGLLKQLSNLPKPYMFGCGALFVTYMVLLYLAIGMAHSPTQVLAVGLANYLWPVLIMLFSLPLLGKRANAWLIPGVLLALTGTWMAVMQDKISSSMELTTSWKSLLPVILAVIAAVMWGLYSNLVRKWAPESGSGVPVFLLSSGLFFLTMRWTTHEISQWDISLIPHILYMAIFPAWLGYLFWDISMRDGNMSLITAFSYFTPVLSTIISLFVLKIQPSPLLGISALLVAIGAIISKAGIHD